MTLRSVGDLLGHAIGAEIALMHPRKRLDPESEPNGTAPIGATPSAKRPPATELMFFLLTDALLRSIHRARVI